VFAPDALPVAMRADAVVALGDRLGVVGSEGDALLLAEGGTLVAAVEGRRCSSSSATSTWTGSSPCSARSASSRSPTASGARGPRGGQPAAGGRRRHDGLADVGAGAGASPAALSLAEVRDELAVVLVNGLGSLTDRVADPLVTRLTDLGLERPAALLREVAARPDPADRLDDLVRLLQVLAVGAVRLAGTRRVDRATLVPVPGHPALLVPEPGPVLSEDEVARRRWAGTMGWPEAAVHRARRLASLPATALEPIVPWWADASATPAVVAAATGGTAETGGRAATGGQSLRQRIEAATSLRFGLTAALTAVAIASASGSLGGDLLGSSSDGPIRRSRDGAGTAGSRRPSGRCAWRLGGRWVLGGRRSAPRPGRSGRAGYAARAARLGARPRQPGRGGARAPAPRIARCCRRSGARSGRTPLRTSGSRPRGRWRRWATRRWSTRSSTLAARARNPEAARGAAYGLGLLGDVRGVAALLDALAEGWKTSVVLDALRWSGEVVLPALVDRAFAEPALAGRRGFVSALESVPPTAVLDALQDRLAARPAPNGRRQVALLRLAAAYKPVAAEIARAILALPPASADATARRSADAVLHPVAKAKPKA
jgi:hypothetical protein